MSSEIISKQIDNFDNYTVTKVIILNGWRINNEL